MQAIQKYVPVTKAKSMLLDLVRTIKDTNDTIAITKNGVPQAVLMSIEKFDGLLETLDVLSDEKVLKSIRRSIREADRGKWLDYDKVFPE